MSEDQASVSNETDIKGKATMKRSSDTRKEQNRVSSRNYRECRLGDSPISHFFACM